jgi:hypothetical protein
MTKPRRTYGLFCTPPTLTDYLEVTGYSLICLLIAGLTVYSFKKIRPGVRRAVIVSLLLSATIIVAIYVYIITLWKFC